MHLILASKSPRRKELLSMLGLQPEILSLQVDEDCDRTMLTHDELVMGLACRKVREAADLLVRSGRGAEEHMLLSADTVVALDGRILEKPKDADDARSMLHALSGRRHEVYTGIALMHNGRFAVDVQMTALWFRALTDEETERYIASGEPMDKAGAYAIQQRGSLFVERIEGDFYNVVGLPLERVDALMQSTFGVGLARLADA